MAWYECIGGSGGGGGDTPIEFTSTQICTNSSAAAGLTLSEDYHNYTFLRFTANTGAGFLATPSLLDEIFARSNNIVNFNRSRTNVYHTYRKTSNTTFAHATYRDIYITGIYGLTPNKTANITDIYKRGAISNSGVSITSTDLFKYDLIIYASCDGAQDETVIPDSYYPISPFDSTFGTKYIIGCMYNNSANLYMTNTTMQSYNWFMVQGIKFT